MAEFDSVLLIAFGGPERPEDIRPFLDIVAAGRRIPPERLEAVARQYERIGGRSPLNELTRRQAVALQSALRRRGRPEPVYVGMRNWHPFFHETLAEMRDRGYGRALGIILSAFQTESSWSRYLADVRAARERVGAGAPEVLFAAPWAGHPRFIETMAERVDRALAGFPEARRRDAAIVFTAHSLPLAAAQASPYVSQFETAARAVAARLGHARWTCAYQSRSGSPADPWLEPDIGDALRALAGEGVRDVVVAPIGFVCDHVEVLYDLDVVARQVASGVGLAMERAATANDHPAFIDMLADLVEQGPAAEPASAAAETASPATEGARPGAAPR